MMPSDMFCESPFHYLSTAKYQVFISFNRLQNMKLYGFITKAYLLSGKILLIKTNDKCWSILPFGGDVVNTAAFNRFGYVISLLMSKFFLSAQRGMGRYY